MFNQIPTMAKYLITYITIIRALATMYALVCYKIALYTEYHITHFTGIRALTMYVLMLYKMAP
jgi:hypothetical protein